MGRQNYTQRKLLLILIIFSFFNKRLIGKQKRIGKYILKY